MTFKLRDYQIKALNVIDRDLKIMPEVLLQGITGSGKTTIFSRLVNKYYKETDKRFLLLVHKSEVVQQMYNTLMNRTDIHFKDIGLCCASLGKKIIDRRVTVASIQTFVNIKEQYQYADLIICDEAHKIDYSKNSQYKQVIEYLRLQKPNCRVFGCSSTPARLGHGFIFGSKCRPGGVNLFPKLNHVITYEELREKGYLVKLKGVIASHESLEQDLAGVSVNGDYVLDQLGDIMTTERHLDTAVEAIEQYCKGYKKICIFTCTIDHSEKLKELIGDQATVVHSQLNSLERQSNMQDWVSGKKRIMVSVNILTEGIDIPELDCLLMARPTLSSTLYLQAVGRVLRISPGKDHGLLVDLTDNTSRFGTDLDHVKVTVPKSVEKLEAKEREMIKLCPECEELVHIALRECGNCAFQWPEAECIIAEALPEMKEVVFEKADPVWYDITHCEIASHVSKKTKRKLGKLIIKYEQTMYHEKTVYVWFCLPDYYTGFAVDKSREKWDMVSDDEFPETIDEFLNADWNEPVRVLVDENNKFPEVIEVECRIPEKNYYTPEDDIHEDMVGMEKPVMSIDYASDDLPF